ncbi:MAG: hypothetical protein B7X99_10280 [Rhizobiales bacterium 17-65-6]|nr:MAG: hypothetical protein B7Z30_02200 [Rhizobiales bacterium 12-68-15]OYZ98788.1 MAG: hypothetical protein B7X99_10280 [Rhizobiales bacterium 17-65-6]
MAWGSQAVKKDVVPLSVDTKLVERLPAPILICDGQTAQILYLNCAAVDRLRPVASALPAAPEALAGHALSALVPGLVPGGAKGRTGIPETRDVEIGGQPFRFSFSSGESERGRPAHLLVTIEAGSTISAAAQRLRQMVDDMPINVMTCVLEDFRIDYANSASINTLRRIEHFLPIRADQLVGSSIDVFHKDPGRIRRLLADPRNLPHTARIRVGPETLELRISAITNLDGTYAGPMLTWALMTETVAIANSVTEVAQGMTRTADTVQQSSEQLLELTEQSQEIAQAVSASAVQMTASFDEISSQLNNATTTSRDMARKASAADTLVSGLAGSLERIGTVTALIDKIASQTNLLALNATIEAARVGEAGKGFAVVAQEVKALAVQTANATKDIRQQVTSVQDSSAEAASSVSEITGNINRLSEVFTAISAAMEEQVVTNRSVSESIIGVSRASGEIRDAANTVSNAATDVTGFVDRLNGELENFLKGRP